MYKVGIVGCGGISSVHAWALQQTENCILSAVCDIVPEKARAFAEKHGIPEEKVFTELDQMLEAGDIDVLHICTPHYLHVSMILSALKRNINVFAEKPVAITENQLMDLKSGISQSSAKAGFCLQNRYNRTTNKLDEIVSSGKYGKVLGGKAFVTWRRDRDYYDGSLWKGKWETEGGGSLMNQSIHTLDLLLRYLGKPIRVEASIQNHHTSEFIEVEDTVEAWMEFEGNRRGCFYSTNCYITDAPPTLELECEKGKLTLTDNHIIIQSGSTLEAVTCEEPAGIGKGYWGSGHLACIRDFYNSLQNNTPFSNNLEGVINTAETTLEIYKKGRKNLWNK